MFWFFYLLLHQFLHFLFGKRNHISNRIKFLSQGVKLIIENRYYCLNTLFYLQGHCFFDIHQWLFKWSNFSRYLIVLFPPLQFHCLKCTWNLLKHVKIFLLCCIFPINKLFLYAICPLMILLLNASLSWQLLILGYPGDLAILKVLFLHF